MPGPLVPILFWGAGLATGVAGGVNFMRGGQKVKRARSEVAAAQERYEQELATTEQAVSMTNDGVHAYGQQQEMCLDVVVRRMADFLLRNDQVVTERASDLLDGIVIDLQRLEGFTGDLMTGEGLLEDVLKAAAAGAATYSSIPVAVAAFGSASTGTAIANLSGAAARNAVMAWLGGGSLVSGGGGMALGAMTLNVVTIGPTILVGGLVLNGKGEKALTEAQRYATDVEASINDQHDLRLRLDLVDSRVEELSDMLSQLEDRGVKALDELERHKVFDPDSHAEEFRRALAYAIAVRDVVSTPVLDNDGTLDDDTERLLFTYRGMT